ncbi:MAG: branched-chain amino acid ABC transporter permease [Lachnospiraceae bacterium]|nr:branched-chain amino acid ABC transporter permease [Lachnospiraceae bacterium]MDY5741512.1 branched-chain amino acid ABC transporter permease [Lachnospiraceae bacterium]
MTKTKKLSYLLTVLLIIGLYFLIAVLVNSGIISAYQAGIMNLICINVILAASLNITVGCLGQITIGHAGFMSIGAYTAGLMAEHVLPAGVGGYLLGLLLGGLLAGVAGVVIGIPALRLRGDYLAIITLAFGEIIRVLIEYFKFTGGAQGLSGIPTFQDFNTFFFLTVFCIILMYAVMTSRFGRAVLAIREDEVAAEASGINTTFYKTLAFALSAVFAGVAGGMYAGNYGVLTAKYFDFNNSINILVMVVLGGMGSFTGAILSAVVLTILPQVLLDFNEYRMIIYALILIIMMIFRPTGLLGRSEFQISRVIRYFRHGKKEGETA